MCDQAVYFDGVPKILWSVSSPGANRDVFRPRIKGGVQFNGVEVRHIMFKPRVGTPGVGIKDSTPVPVEPSGTADVDFHA